MLKDMEMDRSSQNQRRSGSKPEAEEHICLNEWRRPKKEDLHIFDGIYHKVNVKVLDVGNRFWKKNGSYWK